MSPGHRSRTGARRGRLVLRAAAATCVALAGVVLAVPGASGAASATEASWWARATPVSSDDRVEGQRSGAATVARIGHASPGLDAASQVPPPPTVPPAPVPPPTTPPSPITVPEGPQNPPVTVVVPEGGAYVANSPNGPVGMSALRFDAPDAGAATLMLRVAGTSTPLGPIQACPALSGWLPATNGAWSARPAHDCDRLSILGLLSEDGATVTFNLPEVFAPVGTPTYDVLLLPEAGVGTPFTVAFEPPGSESFTVLGPRPGTGDLGAPSPFEVGPGVDATDLAFDPGTGGDLGFGAPDLGGAGFGDLASAAPDAATGDGDAGRDRIEMGRRPAAPLPLLPDDRTSRVVAAGLLVAMGAVLYRLAGQDARTPSLLGPLGAAGEQVTSSEGPVRGLGRFSRPRREPPLRLA